jgi:hypothetical protein
MNLSSWRGTAPALTVAEPPAVGGEEVDGGDAGGEDVHDVGHREHGGSEHADVGERNDGALG